MHLVSYSYSSPLGEGILHPGLLGSGYLSERSQDNRPLFLQLSQKEAHSPTLPPLGYFPTFAGNSSYSQHYRDFIVCLCKNKRPRSWPQYGKDTCIFVPPSKPSAAAARHEL